MKTLETTQGIPIASDAIHCRTTGGFATYAAMCHKAIMETLEENDIDLADVATQVLVGHSLGAASTYLLNLTEAFSKAEIYLFGCPKVLRYMSKSDPHRHVFSVKSIVDPVAMVPGHCRMPRDRQQIITVGSMRYDTLPLIYAPLVLAYQVIYLGIGLLSDVFQKLTKVKIDMGIAKGHSMIGYAMTLNDLDEA